MPLEWDYDIINTGCSPLYNINGFSAGSARKSPRRAELWSHNRLCSGVQSRAWDGESSPEPAHLESTIIPASKSLAAAAAFSFTIDLSYNCTYSKARPGVICSIGFVNAGKTLTFKIVALASHRHKVNSAVVTQHSGCTLVFAASSALVRWDNTLIYHWGNLQCCSKNSKVNTEGFSQQRKRKTPSACNRIVLQPTGEPSPLNALMNAECWGEITEQFCQFGDECVKGHM